MSTHQVRRLKREIKAGKKQKIGQERPGLQDRQSLPQINSQQTSLGLPICQPQSVGTKGKCGIRKGRMWFGAQATKAIVGDKKWEYK